MKNRFGSAAKNEQFLNQYGPWAVVTGASSGIGEALAAYLAESGMNLVLVARSKEKLERLAQTWSREFAIDIRVVVADLADASSGALIQEVTATLDIGLFVASAGLGTSGYFIDSPIAEEVNMLRVNCESLLTLTHHFAKRLAQKRRGGIILMSSIVAFQGVPHAAHYAATKAYVQSLAEGIGAELQPLGVALLAAAPGPVSSGFEKRADMRMTQTLKPADIAWPILTALGKKRTVYPGMLTKFLMASLALVPRWGKVRIMNRVMNAMTKHQQQ